MQDVSFGDAFGVAQLVSLNEFLILHACSTCSGHLLNLDLIMLIKIFL
jgi:hypothetical protein